MIKAIAAAREHGDLSENAEYHAARERQGFIEGRVMELEDKLTRRGHRHQHSERRQDHVRRAGEAGRRGHRRGGVLPSCRPRRGRHQSGLLSIQSPLAQAILGKEAGESVEVTTPRGVRYFEIIEVGYNQPHAAEATGGPPPR